jgi:hypothetical protein
MEKKFIFENLLNRFKKIIKINKKSIKNFLNNLFNFLNKKIKIIIKIKSYFWDKYKRY